MFLSSAPKKLRPQPKMWTIQKIFGQIKTRFSKTTFNTIPYLPSTSPFAPLNVGPVVVYFRVQDAQDQVPRSVRRVQWDSASTTSRARRWRLKSLQMKQVKVSRSTSFQKFPFWEGIPWISFLICEYVLLTVRRQNSAIQLDGIVMYCLSPINLSTHCWLDK